MASLEYLTQNSLIAYPFKGRVAVSTNNSNPIQDNWFLDILFVSYTVTIRSVYISNLEKNAEGELLITFSNTETLQPLQNTSIVVAAADLVDHLQNTSKSFAAYNSDLFSVKFVFGVGIVQKGVFDQSYTPQEAELTSAAIVLRTPDVDNLTFESYENISLENPTGFVKNYTPTDATPVVKPNHNSTFRLTGINTGRLDVSPGAGAGLYDNCPDLKENVYLINQVTPDPYGALFLKTSDCYTSNVLSNNDVILYGQYLDPYKNFVTHTSNNSADDVLFDAVSPQHSIVLENFCKPKCPPENMAAFAYYLNRVTDGAVELDKIASGKEETHGKGSSVLNVFTASSFCVSGNPFIRCVDPDTGLSEISCGTKFIKYYHEGRTLQLYYDNVTVREFIIVEVIDEITVKLDTSPTVPQISNSLLFFRIVDNGVISNVNCAVSMHNLEAASFLTPYFKVRYTTSESFNSDGIYATYLAVNIAIFNPSKESVSIQAVFDPTVLRKQGNYKIRTQDNIIISSQAITTVPCREYAFIEAIFYIPCDETGGSLAIELFDISNEESAKIGSTYSIPNIDGAPCLSTTGGEAHSVRITQANFNTYSKEIAVPYNTTEVSDPIGDFPSWLDLDYIYFQQKVKLTVKPGMSAPTDNAVYVFSYTYSVPGENTVVYVTLDYVAYPLIISPLGSRYTSQEPLAIAKNLTYTPEEPIFKIFAKNMLRLTALFSEDNEAYRYTLSGELPDNLIFDEIKGTLSGTVAQTVNDGDVFDLTITAINPAGSSVASQNIYLAVNIANLPTIQFVNPPENNIFQISNASTYSAETSIYAFSASNNPIEYVLSGQLPTGLFFNTLTGKITGRVVPPCPQTITLSLSARNVFGISNTLLFTLNYTEYAKPLITSPTSGQVIDTELLSITTLANPLFVVTASQLLGGVNNFDPVLTDQTRNVYSAVNLPTGIFIDTYTGKVYGQLSSSLFPPNYTYLNFSRSYYVTITASNPIGQSIVNVVLKFTHVGVPLITNLPVNTVKTIDSSTVYNLENPFFKILATNNPTSFSATGLPSGLSCTNTGNIVGQLGPTVGPGTYPISIVATNAAGNSTAATLKIFLNVAIVAPADLSKIFIEEGVTYTLQSPLLTITTTATTGEQDIIYTVSGLPTGLTLSGNKLIGQKTLTADILIKLTVTSASLGTASRYVYLAPVIKKYSISGTITGGLTLPTGFKIRLTDTTGTVLYANIQNDEFLFSNLNKGTYYLTPNAESDPSYNPAYTFSPATTGLSVSSNILNLNFVASHSYFISGKVVFPKDNPANTDVPISGVAMELGLGKISYTNSDGYYFFNKLSFGEYSIIPRKTGHTFSPESKTLTLTSSDYSATGIDFNLQTTQIISGAITSLSGAKGNKYIPIKLYISSSNNQARSTITDGFGNYSFSAAPSATYRVTPVFEGIQFTPSYREIALVAGQNQTSVNFTSVALVEIAPPAPVITNITATVRQLSVTFTITEITPPGLPVWYYEYSLDEGVTWDSYDGVFAENTLVLTDLQDATEYFVKIRAVNLYSYGEASNTVTKSTPSIPSTPEISLTNAASKIIISVATVSNGGSPILGYKYSLNQGEPVNIGTVLPYEYTQVSVGQTYSFKIFAYNAVGNSAWSSEKSIQFCTKPAAPVITEIDPSDKNAVVYFTATDTGGGLLRTARLDITAADQIHNKQVYINNPTSPLQVNELINGIAYEFRLYVANDFGYSDVSNSVSSTLSSVPDAPIILSSPKYPLKLIIRYATGEGAPSNGGTEVTNYLYSLNNGEYLSAGSAAYPLIITQNILNDVSYTVRIKAVNNEGPSLPSNAITQTPGLSIPETPVISLAEGKPESIELRITELPIDGGQAITNYAYNIIDNSSTNYIEGPVTQITENQITYAQELNPLIITGLNNGQEYTVRLKLKNSIGFSEAAVINVTPKTKPSNVLITNVTPGNQKLTVTFTPPAYNGGIPITGYDYVIQTDANEVYRESLAASANSFIFNSLYLNGTTFNLYVIARNAAYASDPVIYGLIYPETKNATPRTVPDVPTITLTPGDSKIQVNAKITTLEAQGRRVTDFKYILNNASPITVIAPDSNNPDNDWAPLENLDFTFYIEGLVNAQTYTVKVAAVNEAGTGSYSTGLTVTPNTAPSAPTVLSVQPRYRYARVYYTPPENLNKPPILGYVFSKYLTASSAPNNPAIPYAYLNNPLLWTRETVTGDFGLPEVNVTYSGERMAARSIIGVGNTAALGDIIPVRTTPDELVINQTTADNGQVHFSASSFSDGGEAIVDIVMLTDTEWNIYPSVPNGMPVQNLQINYLEDSPTRAYTATFTVASLQNSVSYDFIFKAVSSLEAGESSQQVTVTPAARPPAAEDISFTNIETDTSTLGCVMTVFNDGGAQIDSVVYRVNNNPAEFLIPVHLGPNVTFLSFYNLPPRQEVIIHIAAINSVGRGTFTSLPLTKLTGNPVLEILDVNNMENGSYISLNILDTGYGGEDLIKIQRGREQYDEYNQPYTYWEVISETFRSDDGNPDAVILIEGTNGTVQDVLLRAVNASTNRISSEYTTQIHPFTTPTIHVVKPAGDNSDGIIAVDIGYLTGGRDIIELAYALLPEGHPYYNTPLSVESTELTKVPFNSLYTYNEPYETFVRLTTQNNKRGINYSLFVMLINARGASAGAINIYVSEGVPPLAPILLSAGPTGEINILKLRFRVTEEMLTYGNSQLSGIMCFKTPPVANRDTTYVPELLGEATLDILTGNFLEVANKDVKELTYEIDIDCAGCTIGYMGCEGWYGLNFIAARFYNPAGYGPMSSVIQGSATIPPEPPTVNMARMVVHREYDTNAGAEIVVYQLRLKVSKNDDGGAHIGILEVTEVDGAWHHRIYLSPGDLDGEKVIIKRISEPITMATSQAAFVLRHTEYSPPSERAYNQISIPTLNAQGLSLPDIPNIVVVPGDKQYSITSINSNDLANGGSPILGYQVYHSTSPTFRPWSTTAAYSGTPAYTKSGLVNGTTYYTGVRAITSVTPTLLDTINWQDTPIKPVALPGSPSITSVTGNNRNISIAFNPPSNTGGSPIVNYAYTTDGTRYTGLAPSKITSPIVISRTFTGAFIDNNVSYTIGLRAINSRGAGAASVAKNYLVPKGQAGIPNNLSVVATKTSFLITFEPPTNDGGANIISYKYTVGVAENWTSQNATWLTVYNTNPITVTSATPGLGLYINTGITYLIAVRAVTETYGDGFIAAQQKVAAVAPGAIPTTGSQYMLVQRRGSVFYFRIFYPIDNGGTPITSHQYSLDDGVTWRTGIIIDGYPVPTVGKYIEVLSIEAPYTGSSYKFRARWVNVVGPGPATPIYYVL
jgi:hypothetical protein